MNNKQQQQQFEPGCYFDGARGQYIGEAVIELAASLGFDADPDNSTVDAEFYLEEWERAENWMNENHGRPGYYWGGNEGGGDWGLWDYTDELDPEEFERDE